MASSQDAQWLDEDAGQLVRPYAFTNGRTRPNTPLNLMSMVRDTRRVGTERLDPEHAQALTLCIRPISVAEVAAHLRLPVVVTKILLSDLIDWGAITAQAPPAAAADPTYRDQLEAVLHGLQQL